jgi:hypothetical protein
MIYITNFGGKIKEKRKKPWLGWLKLEAPKALCVKKNPIFNFKKWKNQNKA